MSADLWNKPGIGNVGSYQTAGIPFLTGSTLLVANINTNDAEQLIQFPYVSKAITVINTDPAGAAIKVHYNSLSDAGFVSGGHHYVTLSGSKESITLYHKAQRVYVSLVSSSIAVNSQFELIADLTNIDKDEMFILTGSGLTA